MVLEIVIQIKGPDTLPTFLGEYARPQQQVVATAPGKAERSDTPLQLRFRTSPQDPKKVGTAHFV